MNEIQYHVMLAFALLFILSFLMLKYSVRKVASYEGAETKHPITLKSKHLAPVMTMYSYCLILIQWFDLFEFSFMVTIAFLISIFQPHLSKTSKYNFVVRTPILHRDWDHHLITTSLVYSLSSVLGVYHGQYNVALLCLITTTGSILYHRNRESRYFNFDNIFATSLLVLYGYSVHSSYYHNEAYFLLGMMGLPVALFLIAYCGMPADITIDKLSQCCLRTDRPMYNTVHTLWHLASGVGPLLAVWYFRHLEVRGIHDPYIQQLPLWGVVGGTMLNAVGGYAGIMPLD